MALVVAIWAETVEAKGVRVKTQKVKVRNSIILVFSFEFLVSSFVTWASMVGYKLYSKSSDKESQVTRVKNLDSRIYSKIPMLNTVTFIPVNASINLKISQATAKKITPKKAQVTV